VIRPVTIQAKLLGIFLVAAALPLAFVSLVSYHNSLKAVEEMVGNRTERLARSVGEDLSRKLGRRLRDHLLAENEPVQNFLTAMNRRGSEAQLKAYVELESYSGSLFEEYSRYYREMILADGSGDPVFRFGRSKGTDRIIKAMEAFRSLPNPPPADSLPVPQEFPLPGLAQEIEEWSRSLQAQSDAKAKDLSELDVLEEQEVLPPEIIEAFEDAYSGLAPELGLDDADPELTTRARRPPILRRYLGRESFSREDRQLARNGLLLPNEVSQMLIHRDEASKPLAVRVVRPVFSIKDEDDRLGVLILDIRLDYLFPEDLAAERFGSKGELSIVNSRTGEILFHNRSELTGQDVQLVNPVLAKAIRVHKDAEQTSSWMELEDDRGQQLASIFDIGAQTGWMVVATSFPREFETETRRAGLLNLLVASAAILLALMVLIGSSRRISSSIHKVTEGAREIATGNLSHSIRVNTHDEIQTLADTFNSMTVSLRENISLREKAAAELEALNRTLEDRVQERTHELVALNEALNQANLELKELDRMKSSFLATVSHEFRTPLTSITAFSEILVDEMADARISGEMKRFLGIINAESERLGRLIKNLLDLSRIEAGRMRWERGVFPIEEVLNAARDGLLPVFSEKEVDIVPVFECPGAKVNADRDRIQQVITNLIENAVKFSHKGKRIWLTCRQSAGTSNGRPMIEVTVKDEGPGIPREHLVRIFERFSQVDSTDTRGTGGSGLGLAISREIVEHHGGHIWAESEAGQGAAFHFTLPCASESRGADQKEDREAASGWGDGATQTASARMGKEKKHG
jgi:signal transduction histidine kinase